MWLEVTLGVVLFTALVTGLVAAVLGARSLLLPTGAVEVRVNERRTLRAAMGRKLLDALSEEGLHLPSACGGTGICGLCRVQVLAGGGPLLPTEAALLSPREVREGTRLACQVVLREDLAVRVPGELLGVRRLECTVRSRRLVATFILELVLELPPGEELDFRAGAFVQVTCPPYALPFRALEVPSPYREDWERLDLFRLEARATEPTTRAYSLANHPGERGILMLDVRIATPPPDAPPATPPGIVSSYLFGLEPGDRVTVAGPFGHFFASDTDAEMVFVGGGAGMGPMRAHILDQLERLGTKRTISFWYGARSRRELFYVEEFDRLQAEHPNFRWVAALSEPRPEDDWDGPTGFIHQVLRERYLERHPAPEECEYYLCGPRLMIRATRGLLDELGVDPANVHCDDFGG